MKYGLYVLMAACLLGSVLSAEADKLNDNQKRKLSSLIKDIRKKQETARPIKYEVTLPVSAAGVRGAQSKDGSKFDILWPESTITPLVALVNNIQADIDSGADVNVLREQLNDFMKVFPSYNREQSLQNLAEILK